jgi:hypothetical protein
MDRKEQREGYFKKKADKLRKKLMKSLPTNEMDKIINAEKTANTLADLTYILEGCVDLLEKNGLTEIPLTKPNGEKGVSNPEDIRKYIKDNCYKV